MGQQRIVVEHLLEMRNQPERVGRVARKPAAQLIVDSAICHPVESDPDHREGRRVSAPAPRPKQELEGHRSRKLGSPAEAAVDRVEARGQLPDGALELLPAGIGPAGGDCELVAQVIREQLCLRLDLGAPRVVRIGHRFKDPREARQPMTVVGRKVGAAEEGRQVGGQEDAHRPAAAAGHRLDRGHVHVIEVGALFAIDLDRNELAVEERRGRLVLEGLPLHDVAPVARRVADREKDRSIVLARCRQRLGTPRVPVDRVVRVLQEVRAGLLGQPVRMRRSVAHAFVTEAAAAWPATNCSW